jgi:hypothetical protein
MSDFNLDAVWLTILRENLFLFLTVLSEPGFGGINGFLGFYANC